MEKIILTGACGFIGFNFAKSLPGPLREGAKRARGLITGLAGGTGNTFFEDLGFSYGGDGYYRFISGHGRTQDFWSC